MRTQEQKEKSRKSCKEYYLKTKEARKEYKKNTTQKIKNKF